MIVGAGELGSAGVAQGAAPLFMPSGVSRLEVDRDHDRQGDHYQGRGEQFW